MLPPMTPTGATDAPTGSAIGAAGGELRVLHVTSGTSRSRRDRPPERPASGLDPALLIEELDGLPGVRQSVVGRRGSGLRTVIEIAGSDFEPHVVHAHGTDALRRAVVGLALSGRPTPVVASFSPGTDAGADPATDPGDARAAAVPVRLCRRAHLLLVGSAWREEALVVGVERSRLRVVEGAGEGDGAEEGTPAAAAVLAAYRAVHDSACRRLEYRRRLARRARVRRALPTPTIRPDVGPRPDERDRS